MRALLTTTAVLSILTAASSGLHAAELRFVVLNGAAVEDGSVVTLRPRSVADARELTVETSRGSVVTELAPGRWIWRMTPGRFSPSSGMIEVTPERREVTIELHRVGALRARLSIPDLVPAEIRFVAFVDQTPYGCDVSGLELTCVVPTGRHAVSLHSGTWPPVRLGEIRIDAAGTHLGEIALPRRARVTGLITAPDGTEIRLAATTGGGTRIAKVADGEYAFESVSAGRYRLEVPRDRGRSLASEMFDVPESGTFRVPFDLHVPGYGALLLQLMPPLDPLGESWRVDLLPIPEGLRPSETEIPVAAADEAGRIDVERLEEGRYIVRTAFRKSGAAIASRVIRVDPGSTTIEQLLLAPVNLRGRVRLGAAPPSAGMLEILPLEAEINLNPDGEFETWLPSEGEYWFSAAIAGASGSRRVRVEANEEGLARVDVDLAPRVLEGRTVNPNGEPLRAEVIASWETDHVEAQSGEDGVFRISVPPDEMVRLSARNARGASRELTVSTFEETPQALLEMHPLRPLVLDIDASAAGARLIYTSGRYVVDVWRATAETIEVEVPDLPDDATITVLPLSQSGLQVLEVAKNVSRQKIQIEKESGTLILDAHGALTEAMIPKFRVYWQGAEVDADVLRLWSRQSGVDWLQAGRLVVPAVAPGEIRICAVEVDDRRRESEGDCESGRLFAGGILSLEIPG